MGIPQSLPVFVLQYSTPLFSPAIELKINTAFILFLVSGIGALVLLVLAVHKVFLKRMMEEQERFFMQQISHERDLLIQTVQAQEHEREHIAGELHDAVGNKLNLLSMWINHRTQFPPEKYEDLIRKELVEVIDATRNISHQLFPTRIETVGFIPALDELLSKLRPAFSLELKWPQQSLSFGFECEIQLYRVVQELVSNIVKHSGATKISVQVRSADQAVQLLVGDNGSGFDRSEVSGSMGLTNIESRLLSIKAASKWKASPGKGTRIIIHVPYGNR